MVCLNPITSPRSVNSWHLCFFSSIHHLVHLIHITGSSHSRKEQGKQDTKATKSYRFLRRELLSTFKVSKMAANRKFVASFSGFGDFQPSTLRVLGWFF